jgi:thiamine-phosphate pyrophosphorylase
VTLCLVTDRRRLWPDAPNASACRCLAAQAQHAVDAGIDLVHVREPDLATADLADLVRELVRLRRGSRTRIVVNDRVDVALACGADGVHLRSDSMPADAVRRMVPPGFLIGRSVHGVDQSRVAGPVDYLIAGTVFPTPSKTGTALLGVEGLRRIVGAVQVPVLAIGGVSIERLAAVEATGAAGIAAIGLFVGADAGYQGMCRAVPLAPRVAVIRARFDTSRPPF